MIMSNTPVSLTSTSDGYTEWLAELKTRIHSAQQRAALAVKRETGLAVLADWARHSGAAGGAGLGSEGGRAAGARPAHRIPGDEGVFSPRPQVHAGVCRGLARGRAHL